VIAVGRLDSPVRLDVAAADARWLRQAGAKVEEKTYPTGGHAIPPDLGQRLPDWVGFIEDAGKP
jgi:predicted esterase